MRETLTKFPYINLVVTGQLLFLTTFLAVFFSTMNKKRKKHYSNMSNLPLSEE